MKEVIDAKGKSAFKRSNLRRNLPYVGVLPELASIILNSTDKSVIQKIYLFGSYAHGKPTKNSDLDICVIIDNMDYTSDIYVSIVKSLYRKNIDELDLLLYRERDFYRGENPESIENTIMETGELLYER